MSRFILAEAAESRSGVGLDDNNSDDEEIMLERSLRSKRPGPVISDSESGDDAITPKRFRRSSHSVRFRHVLQQKNAEANKENHQLSSESTEKEDVDGDHELLMDEVKKNTELLFRILERMKKTEGRLRVVESQLKQSRPSESSSSSTPVRARSRNVPDEVRVSTIGLLAWIGGVSCVNYCMVPRNL